MAVISHTAAVDSALSANVAASPAGAASALPVPGLFDALLSQTLDPTEGLPVETLTRPQAQELITGAALVTEPSTAENGPEDAQPSTAAGEDNALLQLLSSLVPAPSETPLPAAQATLAAEAAAALAPIAAQPVSNVVADAVELLAGRSAGEGPSGPLSQIGSPNVASSATLAGLNAEAPPTSPSTLFMAIREATPVARAMFSEPSPLQEPTVFFESFLEGTEPAAATPEPDRSVPLLLSASSSAADSAVTAPAGSGPATPTAETPAEKVIHIPQPPSSPAWRDAFASNVRTLVLEGGGVAELRLDPPDLGPVHIRIELADQTTSVAFAATREDTRAAISEALPLLKDLLAESGIALDGATVNDNVPRREARPERMPGAARRADAEAPVEIRLSRSDRLVDTYA